MVGNYICAEENVDCPSVDDFKVSIHLKDKRKLILKDFKGVGVEVRLGLGFRVFLAG